MEAWIGLKTVILFYQFCHTWGMTLMRKIGFKTTSSILLLLWRIVSITGWKNRPDFSESCRCSLHAWSCRWSQGGYTGSNWETRWRYGWWRLGYGDFFSYGRVYPVRRALSQISSTLISFIESWLALHRNIRSQWSLLKSLEYSTKQQLNSRLLRKVGFMHCILSVHPHLSYHSLALRPLDGSVSSPMTIPRYLHMASANSSGFSCTTWT